MKRFYAKSVCVVSALLVSIPLCFADTPEITGYTDYASREFKVSWSDDAAELCLADMPEITGYTDYTGYGFKASWSGDATNCYLNVFSNSSSVIEVNEDFSGLNYSAGKLDPVNPNIPAYWEFELGLGGEDEIVDGNPVLDYDGEYIMLKNVPGSISSLAMHFNAIADNLVGAESGILRVEYFTIDGSRTMYGDVYLSQIVGYKSLDLIAQIPYGSPDFTTVKISVIQKSTTLGKLEITGIDYSYVGRDTLLCEPAGESGCLVSGLDPEKDYYMYLSRDGEYSNMVSIDAILTPSNLSAADVTNTSYTAMWDYVPKSVGYEVTNKLLLNSDSGVSEAFVEHFSKSVSGSYDNPVSVDVVDAFTDNPGWTGRNIIAVEGGLGADDGRFPYNISYLYTPDMDLSGANGVYKVHVKAHGTAGDDLRLYRVGYTLSDGSLNIHSETFDTNGNIDAEWEMTDGADGMKISIEESALRRFFIEEISISQSGTDDYVMKNLHTVTINDPDVTSYTFTDLAPEQTYGFTVKALRSEKDGSDTSEVFFVKTLTTSISSTFFDVESMSVQGNMLCTKFTVPTQVNVYSAKGCLLYAFIAPAGESTFDLNGFAGFVIVKAGDSRLKAMIR